MKGMEEGIVPHRYIGGMSRPMYEIDILIPETETRFGCWLAQCTNLPLEVPQFRALVTTQIRDQSKAVHLGLLVPKVAHFNRFFSKHFGFLLIFIGARGNVVG
jgi:hypothetical protein